MSHHQFAVSLPIADRRTSFEFYREALGLHPVGDRADDGLPEPLAFSLGGGTLLVLVPRDGFGWVIGGREVASAGHSECVLRLSVGAEADVQRLAASALRAGAVVVSEPQSQPWGFSSVLADPDGHLWMVTTAAT